MQHLIFSLFALCFCINLNAQNKTIKFFSNNPEPGKCYEAVHLADSLNEYDTIYYEIVSPVFEEKIATVNQLMKLNKVSLSDNLVTIEIRQATTIFLQRETTRPNTTVICVVEIPAGYQTISFIHRDSALNLTVRYEIIKEHSDIRIINPTDIHPQTTFFAMPFHYNWREKSSHPICESFSIADIQKGLNQKGYKCTINNIVDEETKTALLKFQRDNKLPEARLDIETLKMLGVDF